MAFTKITEYVKNIKDLPNRPSDAGITPDELKAWFDGRTDKEIKELFNALIYELTMKTAAGQIGAEAVSDDDTSAENIQAKLMYLRAYPDALVKKTMDDFIKSMLLAEQAGKIGADKVSSDDVSADNIQAKLAFIKAYAEAVQKNLESALIDPRVFPDGSVTSGKLAEGAVIAESIAEKAVTQSKLAEDVLALFDAINKALSNAIASVYTKTQTDEKMTAAESNMKKYADAKHLNLTATFGTSWTADSTNGGFYQTVAVDGMLESDNPIADIMLGANVTTNAALNEAWGKVTRMTTADNSVTAWANEEAPAIGFTVQFKVVR